MRQWSGFPLLWAHDALGGGQEEKNIDPCVTKLNQGKSSSSFPFNIHVINYIFTVPICYGDSCAKTGVLEEEHWLSNASSLILFFRYKSVKVTEKYKLTQNHMICSILPHHSPRLTESVLKQDNSALEGEVAWIQF